MASQSTGRDRFESGLEAHSDTSTLSPTVHESQFSQDISITRKAELNAGEEVENYEVSEDERRGTEVAELARRLTQHSVASAAFNNPFAPDPGSNLDPHGPNFDPRGWSKAMLGLHAGDQKAHLLRTSGFSFRNLSVHGFGTTTDYQKSVGNVILEVVGAVRKLMGVRIQHKIDILRSMDGLVESGEMLVVLGPPGSGCSTFLKTVAGETHGFFVDTGSEINYKGMLLQHHFTF